MQVLFRRREQHKALYMLRHAGFGGAIHFIHNEHEKRRLVFGGVLWYSRINSDPDCEKRETEEVL